MIKEIWKELLNCDIEILYGKFGEEYKYLKYSDVVKLLDKYNTMYPDYKDLLYQNDSLHSELQELKDYKKVDFKKMTLEEIEDQLGYKIKYVIFLGEDEIEFDEIKKAIRELEQKHNLGGE